MGIVTALIAAALWLAGWTLACVVFSIGLPAAVVGLVAGLAASFFVGMRLGGARFRSDPVSRMEQRDRARRRYEARIEELTAGDRRRRIHEADREADVRAEARVRELVDRVRTEADEPGVDAPAPAAPVAPGGDPSRTRSGSRPR